MSFGEVAHTEQHSVFQNGPAYHNDRVVQICIIKNVWHCKVGGTCFFKKKTNKVVRENGVTYR